jgi:hypothetical protein
MKPAFTPLQLHADPKKKSKLAKGQKHTTMGIRWWMQILSAYVVSTA